MLRDINISSGGGETMGRINGRRFFERNIFLIYEILNYPEITGIGRRNKQKRR